MSYPSWVASPVLTYDPMSINVVPKAMVLVKGALAIFPVRRMTFFFGAVSLRARSCRPFLHPQSGRTALRPDGYARRVRTVCRRLGRTVGRRGRSVRRASKMGLDDPPQSKSCRCDFGALRASK